MRSHITREKGVERPRRSQSHSKYQLFSPFCANINYMSPRLAPQKRPECNQMVIGKTPARIESSMARSYASPSPKRYNLFIQHNTQLRLTDAATLRQNCEIDFHRAFIIKTCPNYSVQLRLASTSKNRQRCQASLRHIFVSL